MNYSLNHSEKDGMILKWYFNGKTIFQWIPPSKPKVGLLSNLVAWLWAYVSANICIWKRPDKNSGFKSWIWKKTFRTLNHLICLGQFNYYVSVFWGSITFVIWLKMCCQIVVHLKDLFIKNKSSLITIQYKVIGFFSKY